MELGSNTLSRDLISAIPPVEMEELMEIQGLKESRPDLLVDFVS